MKKVLLIYPPSRLFQRGEDRSQGNVEDSTATSIRAPNDLGYAAAELRKRGFEVFLRDYQTENLDLSDLLADVVDIGPDALFASITNSTIFDDLKTIAEVRSAKPDVMVMLKGALFFKLPAEVLQTLDMQDVDYLIGGESEFVVAKLAHAHFFDRPGISSIPGILYRQNDEWKETDFSVWDADLDRLEFPARDLINNSLYVRPDTGEPQATIATSRGCPSACIFCLTPTITGQKVRYRDPTGILEELRVCYHQHGIRNFFFKSDTFTINKAWVKAVCDRIVGSELNGKIEWVANSKVKPLEPETLHYMRDAGCWLVAFGFESGNDETMERIGKGTTVENNRRAAELAARAGVKLFGFYLIGLPWEDRAHLEDTRRLVFELNCDFIEVHLALPYHGTALYDLASREGLIRDTVIGRNYFDAPTRGTKFLPIEEVEAFRRKLLLEYHLRPSYLARKMAEVVRSPRILRNYGRYGLRLIRNNLALAQKTA